MRLLGGSLEICPIFYRSIRSKQYQHMRFSHGCELIGVAGIIEMLLFVSSLIGPITFFSQQNEKVKFEDLLVKHKEILIRWHI
jgi:hypothetical protein